MNIIYIYMVCQGLAKSREHMTYEEASVCLGATKTGSAHFANINPLNAAIQFKFQAFKTHLHHPKMEMVTGNSIIRYITIME